MFLKAARCSICRYHFSLAAGLMSFRLPPRKIACPRCEVDVPTTFEYRASWMGFLVWKLCIGAAFAFYSWQQIQEGNGFFASLPLITMAALLAGGVGGMLLGIVLAWPLQIVVEIVSGAGRMMNAHGPPPKSDDAQADALIAEWARENRIDPSQMPPRR